MRPFLKRQCRQALANRLVPIGLAAVVVLGLAPHARAVPLAWLDEVVQQVVR